MGKEKRFSYEKPISLDAGKVASVLGANCSNGDSATDECISGDNPDIVYVCDATGATADNDCNSNGNSAGSNCLSTGGTAAYVCDSGSSAKYT